METPQPQPHPAAENVMLKPIGYIRSPYRQKFAIPRQPGLVKAARGQLVLQPEFGHPDALRGLEQFSHLWLQFVFHQTQDQGWRNLVRPPRLGGNARLGVYATRSTHRPNPVGLSVVEIGRIQPASRQQKCSEIELIGLDLLDGTPVLDIKPYLPYADALPTATGGFADQSPDAGLTVSFSPPAEQALVAFTQTYPQLAQLIQQVIAQDPRPAYQHEPERVYGMHLYDLNIRWQVRHHHCEVLTITPDQ